MRISFVNQRQPRVTWEESPRRAALLGWPVGVSVGGETESCVGSSVPWAGDLTGLACGRVCGGETESSVGSSVP